MWRGGNGLHAQPGDPQLARDGGGAGGCRPRVSGFCCDGDRMHFVMRRGEKGFHRPGNLQSARDCLARLRVHGRSLCPRPLL
eukprot:1140006-Pelagomonas_calceolata.AAC.6